MMRYNKPIRRGFMALICLLFAGCAMSGGQAISSSPQSSENPAPTEIQQSRFHQDRFVISFWWHPPFDEKVEERYREIAEANFNVVLGGPERKNEIQKQLELCERLGLKAIVSVRRRELANLAPDHPALWGYSWKDEPSATEFASLARDVEQARTLRPRQFLFINLFPNYAPSYALGAPRYREYVRRFVDEVKPDVLCMDHYPRFRPGEEDGRDAYCRNLGVMRRESLRAGIPFWNFFNTMPYGPHTDPTESQLRWQIYASVAYGAKGVLYFCYYTPGGDREFPKGGAIIARDDTRTRHYEQAKRLNAELRNLGPVLMDLTSTRTVRIEPQSDPADELAGGPIRDLRRAPEDPLPDYLVGEFMHKDGRRAALLMNYHFAYSAWPTVVFDAPVETIVEIDKTTGREISVRDESPKMEGTQLSLDAGEGRLFLLPPAAGR